MSRSLLRPVKLESAAAGTRKMIFHCLRSGNENVNNVIQEADEMGGQATPEDA
jgi:hypothetical protein